ncbi:MAG TPA: VCBS repeat-containing protein, partial [Vicinamibacterales bacterium]|nr:VCBS repeat-containing protein [Vicinamibacterales bacterium]
MTAVRTLFVGLSIVTSVAAQEKIPAFEPMQVDVMGAGSTFTNAFADFDTDGDLDLFVGFDGKPNRLYRNDKGTFTDVASTAGVADARPTRAAAWGDFDADGDPDLLLGFTPLKDASVLKLYRNNGGSFVDATNEAGVTVATGAVRQPVWIDFDGDNDLDLFIAFRDRANALYRNDAGKLTDIAASIGLDDKRRTVGAVWFDFDEDGDLDVAVANMDGDANGLFR